MKVKKLLNNALVEEHPCELCKDAEEAEVPPPYRGEERLYSLSKCLHRQLKADPDKLRERRVTSDSWKDVAFGSNGKWREEYRGWPDARQPKGEPMRYVTVAVECTQCMISRTHGIGQGSAGLLLAGAKDHGPVPDPLIACGAHRPRNEHARGTPSGFRIRSRSARRGPWASASFAWPRTSAPSSSSTRR